ncbi:MAG: hypothetical protein HY271_01130 [Deltaproteobacteria bacterium]|nr:hypothetical protein [Deltaproteobacteria bacterium]
MRIVRKPPDPNEIEVVGAPRTPFSDFYYQLLRRHCGSICSAWARRSS